jgi:hypothetical protein
MRILVVSVEESGFSFVTETLIPGPHIRRESSIHDDLQFVDPFSGDFSQGLDRGDWPNTATDQRIGNLVQRVA